MQASLWFTKVWIYFSFLSLSVSSYHLVWHTKDVVPASHIDIHSKYHKPYIRTSKRPKQIIGASVVTSVSTVKDHDPEVMKRHYEDEYRLNNNNASSAVVMEPKFYFYLYDDKGDLVREKLSIHDIQSILLQETQIQGLKTRGWLIGNKDQKSNGSTSPSPVTTSTTKKPVYPSRNATKKDVADVLNKIQNIIENAKSHNSNEIVISNQISISGFDDDGPSTLASTVSPTMTTPLTTTRLTPTLGTFESKAGDFKLYEERYHGLSDYEHPWVDFSKQHQLADLEHGLSEPVSRTSSFNDDDVPYFPVHPQVYRNKVFQDFLSLEEASPYDEEDGSSSIHMISLGNESVLVPIVYYDDEDDQGEDPPLEAESTKVHDSTPDDSHSNHDHVEHSPSHSTHEHEDHHPSKQKGEVGSQDHHPHNESHHNQGHQTSGEHGDHHGEGHGDHHGEGHHEHHHPSGHDEIKDIPNPPKGNLGLLRSTVGLDRNMKHFIEINNELSLSLYSSMRQKNSHNMNVIFSPLSAISTLSMIFLGARGMSSWQMNELLHLDEMISFNPHLLYKQLMDSIMTSGSAGFVKQLLVDQKEDPFIEFYKSRIQYFYNGHADQVEFERVSEEFKERVNKLFQDLSNDKFENLLEDYQIDSDTPMAVMGASYFKCRLNESHFDVVQPAEINFINLPSFGRRLVPTRGLTLHGKIQAGYDPELDATSIQIPLKMPLDLSLILILPGKSSEFKVGGLSTLESKLNLKGWNNLLKRFVPLERAHIYIPALRESSLVNLNTTFSHMGSTEIFGKEANFMGINGGRDLKLSAFYEFSNVSLNHLIKGATKMEAQSHEDNKTYIIRFERQFLYVLRHNPTGLITSIGRYVKPKPED
uniref:Serpin domain-containing protein n=1 Tax=Lepeophtheirus salmonis TaxID=72036 RepID=A0A0K2T0S3_LEPSM